MDTFAVGGTGSFAIVVFFVIGETGNSVVVKSSTEDSPSVGGTGKSVEVTSLSCVSVVSVIHSSMLLRALASGRRTFGTAVIFTSSPLWSIIVMVDSLLMSCFGVVGSCCMTVTVGKVEAVRGLLVGGDMNSVMVDRRGFVLSGFGVLLRYSGGFVGGITASVDCCLRSGTK